MWDVRQINQQQFVLLAAYYFHSDTVEEEAFPFYYLIL
jgi:hypothetical protein